MVDCEPMWVVTIRALAGRFRAPVEVEDSASDLQSAGEGAQRSYLLRLGRGDIRHA